MGQLDVASLVVDRLAEYRKMARETGGLPMDGTVPPSLAKGAKGKVEASVLGKPMKSAGFMKEFFEKIGQVQKIINDGQTNVKQMSDMLEEALMATTPDRERAVTRLLDTLIVDTNKSLREAKAELEKLKESCDQEQEQSPNSAQAKIRTNMHHAMTKKHQRLLLDFQAAQTSFKDAFEGRQRRELQLLMPEATGEEVTEMIQSGDTASTMIAQKMAGAHAMVQDEVARIQEKNKAIRQLEVSMCNLVQMFQEMAVLVEEQGEMLDCIEAHVHKTVEYTAKAEKVLVSARKTQEKNKRMMCYAMVCMMIVLIAILFPILIKN